MEEQIQVSHNPTVGKIVSFLIGIAVIWMLIKAIQKIFSKIKDNNRYKAKVQ
jgi:large-conductance mechanosensitive channel